MSLGTETDLGAGQIVLNEDPAPPESDTAAPFFRPMSIGAKRSPLSATAEYLLAGVRQLCLMPIG